VHGRVSQTPFCANAPTGALNIAIPSFPLVAKSFSAIKCGFAFSANNFRCANFGFGINGFGA
jgi:hypothetical protein